MNTLQGSFTPSNKKPQKKIVVDNPFESLKGVGEATIDTVKQASTDAVKDMWTQILGADKYDAKPSAHKGDLSAGQEVSLKDVAKQKEQKPTNEAPMSYFQEIKNAGKNNLTHESAEIRQQVQSIMYELQRLATTSKAIEKQVSQSIGTGVIKPGVYHANFFEMVLQTITIARKRVENAGAWLQTVNKKKGFFVGMKKNMSQLLSGERSASNSTG